MAYGGHESSSPETPSHIELDVTGQGRPGTSRLHPSVHYSASGSVEESEVVIEMANEAKPLGSEELFVAGTLLKDAKSNRFTNFRMDVASVRAYNLYHHKALVIGQYIFLYLILSLALLEKPSAFSVCSGSFSRWCSMGTLIVELICLLYFAFRVGHYMSFQDTKQFWKDKKNVTMVALLIATFLDMVSYIIWSQYSDRPIRITRVFRPLMLINFPQSRQIRRAFRNTRRTMVEVIFVLILFFASLLFFALLGHKLIGKKNLSGDLPYFDTYFESLWKLYVLVTTANNPDVMMPAYNYSGWYFIFFFIFLVVNLYVFMNILLAVIFNSYKKNMKNEVKATVYAKRQKLSKAFDLLKRRSRGMYAVTLARWHQVLAVAEPRISYAKGDLLFKVLDSGDLGELRRRDFLKAADLLNVPLTEVSDRMNIFERYAAGCYMSKFSMNVRYCIFHRFFRYFFDFAIAVNAVFISIDMQDAEWFFLVLFSLEIILKLYAYGFTLFIKGFWNVFDTLVIGGAFVATVVASSMGDTDAEDNEVLDIILVLRVLRLVKLINGFQRFRVIIMTIVNIAPSILTYGGVLSVVYYVFAILGMELFQGKIVYGEPYCGNPRLKELNSAFVADDYCKNNFNDILRSFVTLVELTVVNQWHVLTSGFVMVTSEWAKIFFFLFHLFAVVIIMNIFIAFILEAFILEYSLSKGKFDSVIENKIKELGHNLGRKHKDFVIAKTQQTRYGLTDHAEAVDRNGNSSGTRGEDEEGDEPSLHHEEGLRFHLKTRGRKKVEDLLQLMFEGEIDPEDVGPDLPDLETYDDDDIDHARASRRMTLDRVLNTSPI